MKPFFVYMLRCADDSFYVGHTDALVERVAQHQAGDVAGYTCSRRPVTLVWSQETASRAEALEAELRIKGWGRVKKLALIAGDWNAIQRHGWGTRNPLPAHLREAVEPEPSFAASDGPSSDTSGGSERPQDDPSIPQDDPSIPQDERRVEKGAPRPVGADPSPPVAADISPPVAADTSPPVAADTSPPVAADTSLPVRPEVSKDSLLSSNAPTQRRALAKAITLLESTRADHRAQADAMLNDLLPHTGRALRIGISGVPGVGKSTFIEALGLALIARGHRVAVLAIDPSSSVGGGSILGDKTRMEKLSVHESAYIRPSPASGTLGGVAEKTREAMLVCEAAGYDRVIVETVGVGQSEIAVHGMTDMFVLLQLPNAGDDLQAIKKGVMELADLVVINKADLDANAAMRAEAQITGVLRMFGFKGDGVGERWQPRVMQLSALKGSGLDAFLANVDTFERLRRANGEFDARRRQQSLAWMWDLINAGLQSNFRRHPAVRAALPQLVAEVSNARAAPSAAARSLLARFAESDGLPAHTATNL